MKGVAGIVHKDDSGTFWFDDLPVRSAADLPTSKVFAGTVWYAAAGIRSEDWAHLLRPGDSAFGPRHGDVLGVNFRIGEKGLMKVYRASTWGVMDRDPNRCYTELAWLMTEAMAADIEVRVSCATTAVRTYFDRYDGNDSHPAIKQLPCRWRGLAHAALHGGPIVVLRGGAPDAVQLDIRRAYLASLREDIPVVSRSDEGGFSLGGWWTSEDREWEHVRSHFGFVDATVKVIGDPFDTNGIPPLPVHLGVGAAYPIGQIRGAWTIAQVVEAEERGEVEVVAVHQWMYSNRQQPLFAEIADFFDELPGPLAKRMYTRFWGKFAMRGGYVGEKRDAPEEGEIPAAGLWWRYEGVGLMDPHAPATYRPDIAAMIAASNHSRVLRTVRRLEPGSVIAVHVDAIWTTDRAGAQVLVEEGLATAVPSDVPGAPPVVAAGSWKLKREGPLRFYGVGAYSHGGHVAASGYDPAVLGPLTEEKLKVWVSKGATRRRQLLLQVRTWHGDPATDVDAWSEPSLLIHGEGTPSPSEGPDVYDPCWTPSGWAREEKAS